MWIALWFALICNYQTLAMKTFMTNEISMPFASKKDDSPTIMWSHDTIPKGYRSSRFERLKGLPVKPVIVKAAVIETDEPAFPSTKAPLIEVAASEMGISPVPVEPIFFETKIEEETNPPAVYMAEVTSKPVIEVEPSIETTVFYDEVEVTTRAPKRRKLRKRNKASRKKTTTTTTTEVPMTTTTATQIPTTTSINAEIVTAELPTTKNPSESVKLGESYLGGWNEEIPDVIVQPDEPSFGSTNQFSVTLPTETIDGDEVLKQYYRKYYEEWYRRNNQAVAVIDAPESSEVTAAPRKINIKLGKNNMENLETTTKNSFGIPVTTDQAPTKEYLDKICDYTNGVSKRLGIKDMVKFTRENCAFVMQLHPRATCKQAQEVMAYCATGVYTPIQ